MFFTPPPRTRNKLDGLTESELRHEVRNFYQTTSKTLTGLRPYPTEDEVQDAAAVWHQRDNINAMQGGIDNPAIPINDAERRALIKETNNSFSEGGMWKVILTVSLSAFLQGFVQSSHNGANLFANQWISQKTENPVNSRFAYANASVYFSAAVVGCPLAAPMSSMFGRRGTIIVASVLIIASSIGSACIELNPDAWVVLGGIRLISGVGMGLKATSTPILAAETAVGSWRGSSVLLWQLWVAFGIMTSFILNICLNQLHDKELTLRLILASPTLFALLLMYAVAKCPESFRYYLMPHSNKYSPEKAYASLLRLRNTKMQAVRDLFLTYKGIEEEMENETDHDREPLKDRASGFGSIGHYVLRYWDILMVRRLRNALIATGIVALSQQLSGINLMAFYGGSTLVGITLDDPSSLESDSKVSKAMLYNVIFGLLNFLFCLPGIHFIDVWGRRRILLLTIPFMAICLMGAAVSAGRLSREAVATWLYLHTVFYSPGMGPVPFILAAESFPLTYRDTGASLAISINFLFAGLLAWLQPLLVDRINFNGTLGVFSGLNVVAFVLIFLLVEETNLNSLETLHQVFNRSKRKFMRFQIFETLPWCWKFIIGTRTLNKPNFNDSHRQEASVHEDEDEERLRDTSQDIRLRNMPGGNGRE